MNLDQTGFIDICIASNQKAHNIITPCVHILFKDKTSCACASTFIYILQFRTLSKMLFTCADPESFVRGVQI